MEVDVQPFVIYETHEFTRRSFPNTVQQAGKARPSAYDVITPPAQPKSTDSMQSSLAISFPSSARPILERQHDLHRFVQCDNIAPIDIGQCTRSARSWADQCRPRRESLAARGEHHRHHDAVVGVHRRIRYCHPDLNDVTLVRTLGAIRLICFGNERSSTLRRRPPHLHLCIQA